MRKRLLGRTGVVVSEFALGTMTFGQEADEPSAFRLLDHYMESDGNLIDTADVYPPAGPRGASEAMDRSRLRGQPPPAQYGLHRPLSGASVGPGHAHRGDASGVRHPRALWKDSVYRSVQRHRVAARADRIDRAPPGRLRPGFSAAAVQPAGTRDRMGAGPRLPRGGDRNCAVGAARTGLAVWEVQSRRRAHRRHSPG